ncbi:DUF1826 domain-containing protein [Gemmata sp. JC673]|uniref:DUF1826 domain-containing protein n=1 Tax=Gemmata algarum TaxID=2975278 RepID=A0ABU5F188_9BACT|nr:DUF1826 domain-containing protein [Gemmata algarum]MDY3561080.1 DUF1826 domain-containing protein [Gemmata algarum]
MTTAPAALHTPVWDYAAVAAFDRSTEDALLIERSPLPEVAGAMRAARVHDWRSSVNAADINGKVAAGLAALGLDCPPLAADIATVARSFLAQFAAPAASLRIEVVTTSTCPKFHCDNIRVRVVATYHGPGTEYVATAAPGDVRAAPTGALLFLKGHKHPTHADAVLHRSPTVPAGEKRLCVVLDI